MSLINQMLQDLEKRQGSENAAPDVSTAQYAQYGTAAPERSNSMGRWILFAVLIAAGFWLFARNLKKTLPIPQAPAVEQVATTNQAASPAVPSIASLPLLLKMSTDIAAPPVVSEVVQQGVEPTKPVTAQAGSNPTQATKLEASISNADGLEKSKVENGAKSALSGSTKSETKTPDASVAEKPLTKNQKDLAPSTASTDLIGKNEGRTQENRATASSEKSSTPSTPLIVKEISPQQKAEGEYKQATVYQQQGRNSEAIQALQQALQLDQNHAPARQLLVSLLLDAKRYDDAIRELRLGLALDTHQVNLAMVLARLLVERAKVAEAVEVLQKSVAYAQERPDYLAFLAALQQKLSHHKEAIAYYRMALARHSQNGVWWMGLGISLQADGSQQDALEAFRQAKIQPGLGADLLAFVDQRIAQLQK